MYVCVRLLGFILVCVGVFLGVSTGGLRGIAGLVGLIGLGVLGVVAAASSVASSAPDRATSSRSLVQFRNHVPNPAETKWAKRPNVQVLTHRGLLIVAVVLPVDQRRVWAAEVAGNLACAEGGGEWTRFMLDQLVALPDHAWVFRRHRRQEQVQ